MDEEETQVQPGPLSNPQSTPMPFVEEVVEDPLLETMDTL